MRINWSLVKGLFLLGLVLFLYAFSSFKNNNRPVSSLYVEFTGEDNVFITSEMVDKLLDSSITNLKFRDRIVFDGYPRNIAQAANLDVLLKKYNQSVNAIIFLNVNRDIIEKRIMGRMTCEKCNMTLNEYFNKEQIELHPCGVEHLKKRKDDNLDIVISRYDTYMSSTKPVLDFYSKNSNFTEIDGAGEIDQITNKINEILTV